MSIDAACSALRQRRVLELTYEGRGRSVEVHAVGYSKIGHPVMRVWQLSGQTTVGEQPGWRLMRLDEVTDAALSDEPSSAPRPGYKPGDPALERIIWEL